MQEINCTEGKDNISQSHFDPITFKLFPSLEALTQRQTSSLPLACWQTPLKGSERLLHVGTFTTYRPPNDKHKDHDFIKGQRQPPFNSGLKDEGHTLLLIQATKSPTNIIFVLLP